METVKTEPALSKSAQKRLNAQRHNESRLASPEQPKLTLEQVEELEALSLEAFNSTSKYQTLMTKGEKVAVTDTVTEYVPAEDGGEGTTKEVQVPVLYLNQQKSVVHRIVRHTAESVKALMVDRIARNKRVRELIAQMQAEQKATQEETQRKAQEAAQLKQSSDKLGGSAV